MKEAGIIRTNNSVVSDFGEHLCEQLLKLKLAPNSAKGYDATKNGIKYQIKTRRLTAKNSSKQLGAFRDLDQKLFDICLIVFLNEDYSIMGVWKVSHAMIQKYAKKTTRGYMRIIFSDSLQQKAKQIYP